MAGKYAQANAFRNLVNRRGKDEDRNLKLAQLAETYANAPKSEKEAFIKSFYSQCGPKGDMSAFIEQYVSNISRQTVAQRDGWVTPGQ
eukprot:2105742-Amphidinium_carterae.1